MPIKKSAITHYILGKSAISVYNLMAFFLFVPYGLVLLSRGYPILNVSLWLVSIMALVLCINYLNFIVNKSDKALMIIGGILLTLYGLDYFQLLPVREFFGPLFHGLYQYPITVLIPLTLAAITYYINYRYLRNRIFLDASLKTKSKEAKTSDLAWTKRFGDMAPFLQLDLKMIWRNKRTKAQVVISLLFVFLWLDFLFAGRIRQYDAHAGILGHFYDGNFLDQFWTVHPSLGQLLLQYDDVPEHTLT